MNDISKIKLIHDVKQSFSISDDLTNQLIDQIESEDKKENIDRFYQGYANETIFKHLFSELPWTELVHELNQDQYPCESKEDIQVPDALAFFKTSAKNIKPVLVEIKRVSERKTTIELMSKQIKACNKYASIAQIPLLYAIYWELFDVWTINSVDHFDLTKKRFKVSLFEAFKQDISCIFGDLTFILDKKVFRKTQYTNIIQKNNIFRHTRHGYVLKDYLSLDDKNYIEVSELESSALGHNIQFYEISCTKKDSVVEVIECSDSEHLIRFSTMVLKHLARLKCDVKTDYVRMSANSISGVLGKLAVKEMLMFPKDSTQQDRMLIDQAFSRIL